MEGPGSRSWDVFLSYSRGDAHRIAPLRDRLLASGLDVFVDEVTVAGFAGISDTIRDGLARSKALLACYSAAYPERQACQWELTAAYLAGLREGDPRRRVMVVNPEPTADHIHPVELRDAKHWALPAGAAALDALIADVRAHVSALTDPIGVTETPPAAHWLPGPSPSPATAFTGRLPFLWQVHSFLHRHAAPLTTGHSAARPVQIRGMAGIGKTLLAQEYATRFAAAYPGGIHWLARDPAGGAGDPYGTAAPYGPYEGALRALAAAHGLPRGGTPEEVAGRLGAHFASVGEPFLWVVDDLADQLTAHQVARLCAPHPLGRTLLTTRSRRYDALATPVEPGPLGADESYALLTHAAEPRGPEERAAAEALCAAVAGHPLALDLLSSGAADGYATLHDRFHTPGRSLLDVLARGRVLPTGYPAEVTATLVRDVPAAGPCAMDVLRLAAAFSPTPLTRDDAVRALSSAATVPDIATARRLDSGIAELRGRNLLTPAGTRSWSAHPLLIHAWLRHDPEPARAERLRHAVLRTLRTSYGTTLARIGARPGTTGPTGTREPQMKPHTPAQRDGAPSELERMAAFDLQVELATRIGVQELAPGAGSLREALASLHAMFEFTRTTLRQYSINLADQPGPEGARTVHAIADDLLNRTLRPFTSEWHTRLAAHEALRPEGTSPVAHEQSWPEAPAMRTALAGLREPLLRIVGELADISGAGFGLPAAS
ncbi:toll/interleukin-1 receptor domain-containing protein [Streptomyces sp. ISL-11]|uniref:tetratricopeptide repeat protein n=1 Tax=Streptomyces sp. ISL-11 TaxID=2819174 RepID=UPI001BE82265|nr:toll/interleukin-1 receptor domain-containing protein [Streptomyces sp. ISL-11]MBT2387783.1 toll/interleukin-1 receptor domain-containing protein [Streptomyces sp. ISL-11]